MSPFTKFGYRAFSNPDVALIGAALVSIMEESDLDIDDNDRTLAHLTYYSIDNLSDTPKTLSDPAQHSRAVIWVIKRGIRSLIDCPLKRRKYINLPDTPELLNSLRDLYNLFKV